MLVFAFEAPKGSPRGPLVLVVILTRENFQRMYEADPPDIQFSGYAAHLPVQRPLRDVDMVIAYEEDEQAVVKFQADNNLAGLMRWLERGRKIKPGDLQPPRRARREQ